jgi:bifunctional non-homologous end joining protein LigD
MTDVIRIDDRQIKVTNLDRVMYPEAGTTKADVIAYYAAVASRLLPLARRRPVTRIRWPQGTSGEHFYEKNLQRFAPRWIERLTLDHSDGPINYPLIDEPAGLVWLAQNNALELHVPQWRVDETGRTTDRLVLDLDPGPGAGLPECLEVALWLRAQLDAVDMPSVPVTSGSKGIHLYAGWVERSDGVDSITFARELARQATEQLPKLVTDNMTKRLRERKVLVDWSQNNPAKTTICPYSLRGKQLPFVATPRLWSEIEHGTFTQLTMDDVLSQGVDHAPMTRLGG